MKLPKEEAKKLTEFRQFERFAGQMNWPCSQDNVKHMKIPSPDIEYSGLVETVALEITSIIENEIAQAYSNAVNGQIIYPTFNARSVINKKLGKVYSSTHSIELLVCHDGAMATDDMVIPELQEAIGIAPSNPFQKIWYSGENGATLVYPFE